jgi:hypothetical protein
MRAGKMLMEREEARGASVGEKNYSHSAHRESEMHVVKAQECAPTRPT